MKKKLTFLFIGTLFIATKILSTEVAVYGVQEYWFGVNHDLKGFLRLDANEELLEPLRYETYDTVKNVTEIYLGALVAIHEQAQETPRTKEISFGSTNEIPCFSIKPLGMHLSDTVFLVNNVDYHFDNSEQSLVMVLNLSPNTKLLTPIRHDVYDEKANMTNVFLGAIVAIDEASVNEGQVANIPVGEYPKGAFKVSRVNKFFEPPFLIPEPPIMFPEPPPIKIPEMYEAMSLAEALPKKSESLGELSPKISRRLFPKRDINEEDWYQGFLIPTAFSAE